MSPDRSLDSSNYDKELRMFRDPPKEAIVILEQVKFQRWLAENGRHEHKPSGPPSGEFAVLLERMTGTPLVRAASAPEPQS